MRAPLGVSLPCLRQHRGSPVQLLAQLQMQPVPLPQYKREVAETDKFCPYCAFELAEGQPSIASPNAIS
jgi:hypothetical protein